MSRMILYGTDGERQAAGEGAAAGAAREFRLPGRAADGPPEPGAFFLVEIVIRQHRPQMYENTTCQVFWGREAQGVNKHLKV